MPQHIAHSRFTMTACIDVETRTVLGYRVGTEPPGVGSALLALQHALPRESWGCPTGILIDHFQSTPMLQALSELGNGVAGKSDSES
jgi:hypothetical protein